MKETLHGCKAKRLVELAGSWDNLADVAELLEATLVDPPPLIFQLSAASSAPESTLNWTIMSV